MGYSILTRQALPRRCKTEQRPAWNIPTIMDYTAGSAIVAGIQGWARWYRSCRRSFHPHPECVMLTGSGDRKGSSPFKIDQNLAPVDRHEGI